MMNKIITTGVVLIGLSLIFMNAGNVSDSMSFNQIPGNGMQAAAVTSLNSVDSCNVSNRRYGFISIAHHVGSPELFTNFVDCPTKTAIKSGDWSDSSVWGGSIPGKEDIVLIPKNTNITLSNSTRVKTVGVAGSLVFNDRSNVNFEVENFQTLSGSSLTIDPTDSVVHKIIFTGNVEANRDPAQYGLGLVAIDSNVKINGRSTRATNSKIVSANAGSNSITVADNISDWKVGQNVIFADTEKAGDQYVPHTEIKKITSVNGNNLTIDSPLSNTYKSSVVYAGQNVIFTSNAPVSGHILFTGNTKLDFLGAYIEKMGRTRSAPVSSVTFNSDGEVLGLPNNQIGRYSLHTHHLEQAYNISGNVINNTGDPTLRWSATLHASYGSFTNNSIVNPGEAAIGVETYVDTGDISNNLVIGSGGGADYNQQFQSFGIWSRSPFVNINNNRVEGWTRFYSYFIDPDGSQAYVGQTFPNISGSPKAGAIVHDQEKPGTFYGNVNTAYTGFAKGNDFRRASALWLGHFFGSVYVVDNFKSTKGGITAYYSRDFTFNNVKLNETEQTSNSSQYGYVGVGVLNSSFNNSEITGFQAGFIPGSISEFKNGKLDNKIDFVSVIGDQDCYCHVDSPGETITLDSVQFSPTGMHVVMVPKFSYAFELSRKIANPSEISSDVAAIMNSGSQYILKMLNPNARVILKNYNLQGQDYIVYPTYQTPDFVIPMFGISNQDLYNGKGTVSYSVGMYGRSLGDYIVRNPIPNSKIFGLVENIKPVRVLASMDDFTPQEVSPSYNLHYYTNSLGTKVNPSNYLINYGGDGHVINNFKGFRGLNKIQVKVDSNPYTLLFYGPEGLPAGTQPADQPVVIDTPNTPDTSKPITNPLIVPLKPISPGSSGVTILTSGGQTTFGLGNVAFTSSGPVGVYRWNITDSNGKVSTQSNGNTIQTMYYNFTAPGVYNVSLTVLDASGKVLGVSNTITVNIIPRATVPEPLFPISTVAPHISVLSPSLVSSGDTVKLTGTAFLGGNLLNVNIKSTNGTVISNPTIKSSSASEINFIAPKINPGTYYITVLNSGGESNITLLTIQSGAQTLSPKIDSIQPSNTAKVGDTITLLGSRFAGVDASRVYLIMSNGTKLPIIFITSDDSRVVFNVPNITPGAYKVAVSAYSGISNSVDLTVNAVAKLTSSQTLSGTCPYNTNVSIPAGQSSVTVYANLLSQYVSGGTAPYTVDPSNLTFAAAQKFLVNLNVRDSAGHVASVPCNFNVSLSPTPTQTPSQTPASSNSQIQITTDSNQTVFGLGNVRFYSSGPVGVYRWSIADSNGKVATQSNGNVIQTMYYNFTAPGVYNVALAILDGNGNLIGISNTITVTITNSNGASVFNLFDWFVSLFVKN